MSLLAGQTVLTTFQRDLLGSVLNGTLIFNTTNQRMEVYSENMWKSIIQNPEDSPLGVIRGNGNQTNWIASYFGASGFNKVVVGTYLTHASIGAHASELDAWATLYLRQSKLMAIAGSVSAPSIGFNDDNNSGIYSEGDNTIAFGVNGVKKMDIYNNHIRTFTKLLITDGTEAEPYLAFQGSTQTGLFLPATNILGITAAGIKRFHVSSTEVLSTLPITLPNGTAALPAITFTSGVNTGIYSSEADNLSISTGGVERLKCNNTNINFLTNNVNVDSGRLTVSCGVSLGSNWIAANIGATNYNNRIVMGSIAAKATIGAHNHSLTGWTNLEIANPVNVYPSDVRLKDNITNSTCNALAELKTIRIVEYDWKTDDNRVMSEKKGKHVCYGVIANELELIYPEKVQDMDSIKSVTGSFGDSAYLMLVKACQEQQILIEALTARVTTLEE
jgi:hypothetical protein